MGLIKTPSHDIFQKPGDEGPRYSQGQADCPNEAMPAPASREHIQRPGDEGAEVRGVRGMNDNSEMGYQNPPMAQSMDLLGKGPEVRKTYIPPATGSDPTPDMPGAK